MLDTAVQASSNILCALLGALFAFLIFRGGKQSEVARERLNSVYAPIFKRIEPFLYRNISLAECDKIVCELKDLARQGGVLTSPSLLYLIDWYLEHPREDLKSYKSYTYKYLETKSCYLTDWYRICAEVDRTYDALCRDAFLPIRKISYRLDYKQYISKLRWVISSFIFNFPYVLMLLLACLLVLALSQAK